MARGASLWKECGPDDLLGVKAIVREDEHTTDCSSA